MSKENIRQAIVAKMEEIRKGYDANPGLKIEYDNALAVDISKQTEPFLLCRIKFLDAEQVGISDKPMQRFYGNIELAVAVKEYTGTAKANAILDYFYPKLQRTQFVAVRTYMATVAADKKENGWVYIPMQVPFWSDQIV